MRRLTHCGFYGANEALTMKKKGQCTFDVRGQKEVAKPQGRELNTSAPCTSASTHKAQLNRATAEARKVRTLDVRHWRLLER